jgi:hypothetical protein
MFISKIGGQANDRSRGRQRSAVQSRVEKVQNGGQAEESNPRWYAKVQTDWQAQDRQKG